MIPYYDKDGITIYCGDCLEVMPQLDLVFDTIIADLPYGTTACSWDTVIPFEPLWENYKRLVKKIGAVVLFGSQPFTSKLVMSNLEWFRYCWYYKKERGTGFVMSDRRPLMVIEEVVIFCKKQSVYNPQTKPLKKPYTHVLPLKKGEYQNSEILGNSTDQNTRLYKTYTHSTPDQLLQFSRITKNTVHPTQKPVSLLQYLIRTYTNPGDLILDNTMGSGTTLVAAQREGRQATGIEISEEYCKIAVERLQQPSFFSIPDVLKNEKKPKQIAMEMI